MMDMHPEYQEYAEKADQHSNTEGQTHVKEINMNKITFYSKSKERENIQRQKLMIMFWAAIQSS